MNDNERMVKDIAKKLDDIANGCLYICPCCGENREYDFKGDRTYGIVKYNGSFWHGSKLKYKYPILGAFLFLNRDNKHWRTSIFKCVTCGAEWESDPYPVELD